MIRHPQVLILGYSEASMLLSKARAAAAVGALIGIHGQREFVVETGGGTHRLILHFDDCESPSRTDPIEAARVRLHNREVAQRTGLTLTPPAPEHARAIIDFADSICGMDGALLCQCHGGVSRSPAAALLCLATWMGAGHEYYCVEYVLTARSCAIPHLDLVEFGDELLGRRGALTAALQRARQY